MENGAFMHDWFRRFAHKTSTAAGSPLAFAVSALIIVVWAFLGSTFHYSDTWQLVINTGTTIITFLMVFLIQNTQNRDARAIHIKLDELIHANKNARNRLIDLEEMADDELDRLHNELVEMKKDTDNHIDRILKTKKNKP